MASSTQHPKFRLKDSVYALEDPNLGIYIALKGPAPRLKPLRLATLAPATAAGRRELAIVASGTIAGQPHELVRVDA